MVLFTAERINSRMRVKRIQGFTLIELLVVISIIAILSTIGFLTYTTVLKQGRDSKRQSDLRSIQSALEQYRADVGNYPASLTSSLKSPDNSKIYLNEVPKDPKGTEYGYEKVSALIYCIYTNLENTSPVKPSACINGSYNFAVTPP